MGFKTELHCHSSEFSRCSSQSGADKAKMYIENGYTTVVLTNHFCSSYPEHADYPAFVRNFYHAGEIMREAAGDKLNIITGMELTFKENGNDYLVFGMTEEKLLSVPQIFDMGLRCFYGWAKDNDVTVIQAHPMRFGIAVTEPWFVDGLEVYNASHDPYCNEAAEIWAAMYDPKYNRENRRFILTSGSDHHREGQWANGGIETEEPIRNMDDLLKVLWSGEYTLLRG